MGRPPLAREKILAAARQIVERDGAGALTFDELVRESGITRGGITYHFPTKEDLLRATLELRLELLQPEVLDPIWTRIDDPIERVFGLLDGYRQMLTITEFRHGCPIGNLVLELAESHPKIRKLLAANFDNWSTAIADFVSR